MKYTIDTDEKVIIIHDKISVSAFLKLVHAHADLTSYDIKGFEEKEKQYVYPYSPYSYPYPYISTCNTGTYSTDDITLTIHHI